MFAWQMVWGDPPPLPIPSDFFTSGEVGVWYDPSDLETLYTSGSANSNVTNDGDIVYLMMDKSQWIGNNLASVLFDLPELNPDGITSTGWNVSANPTFGEGYVTIPDVGGADGFIRRPVTGALNGDLIRITLEITSSSVASSGFRIRHGSTGDTNAYGDIMIGGYVGTWEYNLIAGQDNPWLTFLTSTTNGSVTLTSISFKVIPGNHIYQPTAASRPVYKTDSGLHWLESDGIDDSLITKKTTIPLRAGYFAAMGFSLSGDDGSPSINSDFGAGSTGNTRAFLGTRRTAGHSIIGSQLRINGGSLFNPDQNGAYVRGTPFVLSHRHVDNVLYVESDLTVKSLAADLAGTSATSGLHIFSNGVSQKFYGGVWVTREPKETEYSDLRYYLTGKCTPLVAPITEIRENSIIDTTGNYTWIASPSSPTATITDDGPALSFDHQGLVSQALNDYFRLGSVTEYTVAARVKPTVLGPTGFVFDLGSFTAWGFGFGLRTIGGVNNFHLYQGHPDYNGGTSTVGGGSWVSGSWYNCAMGFSFSDGVIYFIVDGVVVYEDTISYTWDLRTDAASIGQQAKSKDNTRAFYGDMRGLAVWDKRLSMHQLNTWFNTF